MPTNSNVLLPDAPATGAVVVVVTGEPNCTAPKLVAPIAADEVVGDGVDPPPPPNIPPAIPSKSSIGYFFKYSTSPTTAAMATPMSNVGLRVPRPLDTTLAVLLACGFWIAAGGVTVVLAA